MEPLTKYNITNSRIQKRRNEVLEEITFTEVISTGSLYASVSSSFYGKNPIEIVPNQVPSWNTNTIYIYQPPLSYRGDGIIPSTVVVTNDNFILTDDGNGNLVDSDTQDIVGNVFYNTGVFVISDNAYNEIVSITYERFVYFLETRYTIDIQHKKYKNSSNPTFFNSNSPNPFLTKILLYNQRHEIIGVATLNSPIELDTDMLVELDLLSV